MRSSVARPSASQADDHRPMRSSVARPSAYQADDHRPMRSSVTRPSAPQADDRSTSRDHRPSRRGMRCLSEPWWPTVNGPPSVASILPTGLRPYPTHSRLRFRLIVSLRPFSPVVVHLPPFTTHASLTCVTQKETRALATGCWKTGHRPGQVRRARSKGESAQLGESDQSGSI